MDLQNNEPIQGSQNIWTISISILATTIIVGGCVYAFQKYNQKASEQALLQQISSLQNQINQLKKEQLSSNQVQEPQSPITSQPTSSTKAWNAYHSQNLDISFQYPSSWQPIADYESWRDNFFRLEYKPTELKRDSDGHLHIVGINHKTYVDEGHAGWYGYCAVQYKNMADFCKEGCEKINNNVAIDYRHVFHGESGFSAIAYTDLSSKFPSICFELDLIQIYQELSSEEMTASGIKTAIKNKHVSAPILQAVENFEQFARTIKRR